MNDPLQRLALVPRPAVEAFRTLAILTAAAFMITGCHTEKVDLSNYADLTPPQILVTAARKGDLPVVGKMLRDGVDVNAVGEGRTTPLIAAVLTGKVEVIKVLLAHGANPNVRDARGFTPLMWARDGATVDVLVQHGADLRAKGPEGLTLIEVSSNSSDPSRLAALLRCGVPLDPKTEGPTLMMTAAWRNEVSIISFLLARGIDPNLKGVWNKEANDYMTPLTAAVVDGQYDAAKLLVEHGAKIEEPGENGKPGANNMTDALFNRRTQMVKLFWDRGDRSISELLYDVSQGAPVSELQKLFDGGMPANPPQDSEIAPLEDAALLGEMNVVQLLVQHGADVNKAMSSASEGQDEIISLLLKHGAKFDYETLWDAVWNCNPYPDQRSKDHFEKTIKLLIDAGGLKGLSEKNQAKLLTAAIFSRYPGGNQNVIHMLLDGGLSLNARGEGGQTVMQMVHGACKEQTCSTPTKEMLAFLEKSSGEKISP